MAGKYNPHPTSPGQKGGKRVRPPAYPIPKVGPLNGTPLPIGVVVKSTTSKNTV